MRFKWILVSLAAVVLCAIVDGSGTSDTGLVVIVSLCSSSVVVVCAAIGRVSVSVAVAKATVLLNKLAVSVVDSIVAVVVVFVVGVVVIEESTDVADPVQKVPWGIHRANAEWKKSPALTVTVGMEVVVEIEVSSGGVFAVPGRDGNVVVLVSIVVEEEEVLPAVTLCRYVVSQTVDVDVTCAPPPSAVSTTDNGAASSQNSCCSAITVER